MQSVLAQSRRVLLEAFFELLRNTTFDVHLGSVIEIAGFGALKPHVLTVHLAFGHDHLTSGKVSDSTVTAVEPSIEPSSPSSVKENEPANRLWSQSPGFAPRGTVAEGSGRGYTVREPDPRKALGSLEFQRKPVPTIGVNRNREDSQRA